MEEFFSKIHTLPSGILYLSRYLSLAGEEYRFVAFDRCVIDNMRHFSKFPLAINRKRQPRNNETKALQSIESHKRMERIAIARQQSCLVSGNSIFGRYRIIRRNGSATTGEHSYSVCIIFVSLIARSRFAALCMRIVPIAPFVLPSMNYRQGDVFKLTCNQSPGTSLTFTFCSFQRKSL